MSQQTAFNKRPAQYRINQRTLQDQQQQTNKHQNGSILQKQTKPTERMIFKVKRDNVIQQHAQHKTKFQLIPNENKQLTNPQKNISEKVDPSIFQSNTPLQPILFQTSATKKLDFTNLFTSNKGTQQTAKTAANINNNLFMEIKPLFSTNQPTVNLFSNLNKQGGIFNTNTKENLFDLARKSSEGKGSLFQTKKSKDQQEQQQSGQDQQLEKQQNLTFDKTKSTGKFQYASEEQILLTKQVKKLRKNANNVIENVQVQLQADKQIKNVLLVCRMGVTKNIIIHGYIRKDKSTLRNINQKQQNIQITIYTLIKKNQQQFIEKNVLKLQFQNQSDGKQFADQFRKYI